MKKIIFLIFYIAFVSSCLQQMEAPESARVSGSWAVIDENNMTTSTLTFQGGYFEEYQSYRACYVEGKTVWGVDESTFERKSRNKYSLIDGVLYCADKSVNLVVENEVMTFGANKCMPIDDLNPSFYSEIVLSKTNKTSFLYSDREIEWHYGIENPVEGFNLVVKEAPEWCGGVKGVTVEGDKIRFTVQSTTENLSGKFVFSYLSAENVEVRVKQSAAQIALDRTSAMFDYSSATGEFAYTIPNKQEGYELEIKSDVDWIVDIKNKGDKITYSVLENNSGSERVGKITLTYAGVSADYTVTQKYSATLIKLSPSSATHTYVGGSYSFKYVVENPREGNNVSVSTPDSWITGVKEVDGVVSYTVSENNSGAARTGNVTLTYGDNSTDFKITQTYSAVSITLSPSSSTHDYTSGTYTFDYTISNPREGRKVSLSTSDFWITGVVDSNGTVSYSVAENNSGSSRTGKIAIHYAGVSKEFTVTQTYDAVSITFSPSSSTHDYTSGTYNFDYTISNPREGQKVSVSTSDSWITGVVDSNGTVSYSVAENNSGSSRTGKITLTYAGVSKEFSVTQSYTAPSISLSPISASHDYTSGAYNFKYTISNPREGQKATVSTSDSWITGVTDTNGTVSYSVAENNSGSSRTGKITLTYAGVSKEFSVTQSYTAPSISLSPISASHDYTSGAYNFKYTISNPREGQKATVSTSDSWITGVTDTNGTVSYTVVENNSGSSRTGKITVTYAGVSKQFIVTQQKGFVELSESGTANCYVVSETGFYFFKSVKGNSSTSVGTVSSVAVLWESFGTSTAPSVGDLVQSVSYRDGDIYFTTPSTFKEGNAVIAAKDASGKILWSWHIWFTDQPEGQVYYNNAGTMMDRNLGATSSTPGDVGALGLLYQWGRKDPFLGSSSISSDTAAKSTITWPSPVSSNSSNGTISYATAHPTTFITNNSSNYDWYYTGSSSTDNTRWTTSSKTKSIYDPCPAGWRVGSNSWSMALGSSSSFTNSSLYNSSNEGVNFSGKFGSASTIWYPASGYRYGFDGSLRNVGNYGYCWSALHGDNFQAYDLYFNSNGSVYPSNGNIRARGISVRCLRESK